MDDFYAECDEHLVEIRHCLLKLEEQMAGGKLDAQTLQKIFRCLHSVKGICGMAGLQSAEKLAHSAESYLRALTRQEAVASPAGLDVLTRVTQKLEELALSRRQGLAEPDAEPLIRETDSLASSGSGASRTEPDSTKVTSEPNTEDEILLCVFRPSPELAKQGINVNSVRSELQALGQILQASPRVEPGGELLFEFVISAPRGSVSREALEAKGIRIKTTEAPPPVTPKPPTAAAGAANLGVSPFVAPSQFVRVEMSRLDDLMRIMGDVVVDQARLEDALAQASGALSSGASNHLQEVRQGLDRDLRHLRDGLMGLRLVPLGEVFDRLPFVVRDISHETGKKARLVIKGQDTELDKYLVERMKDPLLHLVRNAVSHGIEAPAERVALGKAAEGTITLRAYAIAESVTIEIADDGRGLDRGAILKRAQNSGLEAPAEADSSDLLDFICLPGFSTRETADLGAGRGIGMSAVKSTILDLGGELEVESEPQRGTLFRLRLPLTLAVADALIISAGGQRFAMPQAVVQEITTTEPSAIKHLEQNEIIRHRSSVLPLLRLTSIFGLPREPLTSYPVLVIGTGLNAVGIVADRVLGHREIVVRPIKDPFLKVPGVSGATELGDGRAVLILDSASLAQRARGRSGLARKPPVEAIKKT